MTRTICVIPIPDSEFTPEEASGCTNSDNPLVVDFDNESNTLDSCDPDAEYTWSVGFDPGDCGASPSWTQLDRTPLNPLDNPDLNDQDIRLRFDSAGIYTVYLTVENECGINTDSTIVTVSGAPKIDITPIPDSCFVETFIVTPTLSFDADCFSVPTYEWSFPGGSPNRHTGEFPPAISYDISGNYTIRLTVENDCGETVVTEQFELFPPPDIPNIEVTEEVCVGGTITATNPLPPDPASNTYSWTGPNGFTSFSDTWTISPATTVNAGTYTLTVTDENGCTNTMDYLVNVTLSAPIQISPDPAVVCVGEDLELTASGGVTYDWQPTDHITPTTGSRVIFNHDVVGEYQIIVIGSDPAGECDGSDTIIVNVVPLPVVDAGEERLGCTGTDFDFQPGASPQIMAGTTGIWTGDHISEAGIFNVDIPGEYTVTYTFTDEFGCSGSDDATICIRDLPEASFTLPSDTGCVADDFTLRPENTSNTSDDCAPAAYLWSITYDDGECSDSGSPIFVEGTNSASLEPVIQFNESGRYTLTLTVTNDCGTDMFSEVVTVGDVPTVVITGVADQCGPQPVNFAADISACDSEILTYAWDFPTADPPATSDLETPAPVPFPVGTHTVTLAVTNGCGTSTSMTTFEVLEGPMIDITLPQDSVCVGDQITVTGNSTGTSLSFSWAASDANITFSDPNIETPVIDFSGVSLGDYSVTVTVVNSVCDPVMTTFNVYVNDLPTVALDSISDGCGSVSFSPGVSFGIPVENVDDFLWELNDGTTTETISTDADPGTIAVNEPGNYTLTVTATNECGTDSASQPFRVLEGPSLDVMLDTTFVCRGGSVTVINNSTGDDLEFDWSVEPSDGVVIDDINSRNPTITFNGPVGDYEVTANIGNDLCERLTFSQTVEVSDVPVVTVDDLPDGCGQTSIVPVVTYGLTDDLIDSVRWEVVRTMGADAGTVVYSGAAVNTPIDVVGPGTYTFTATAFNRCAPTGVSAETSFRLFESPTGNYVTDTDFVCRGTGTVSLTSNFTGDIGTYEWTVTEVATSQVIADLASNEENPTFTFGPGLNLGDYTIAVSLGNTECSSIPWDTTITLSAQPANITLGDIDPACDNITFDPAPDYGEFTAEFIDSVRWTFPPGSTPITSTELDPGPVSLSTVGLGLEVRLDVFNGCGTETATTTFDLLVGPVLDVSIDTNFVCLGDAVTITNNSAGDNLEYEWTAEPSEGVTFSDPNGADPTITFNGQVGDYTISAEIGNPICGNLTWDTIIRVSAPVTATLEDIDPACDNITFTPVPTYSLDDEFIDSVRWTFPPGSTPITSTELDPGPVSLSTVGLGLEVRLDVFNGCGTETATTTFDLLVGPVLDVSVDTNFVCLGDAVTITNNSAGDNLEYEWTAEPSEGVTFSDPNGADPTITFNGQVGDYTISAEIGNPICGNLTWDTIIRVSAPVTATLEDIDPACDNITFTPVPTYSLDDEFIDSVRWTFPPGSMPITSTELRPTDISLSTTGLGLEVRLDIFNGCGTETATTTFDLLVGPVLDVTIDTNFVCLGEAVTVTNNSIGDNLVYSWTATPPDGVSFSDPNERAPTITFNGDVGDYTISAEIGNPICGNLTWDTIIRVSAPVTATLEDIDPACDNITFSPVPTYSLDDEFIDSVRWTFPPGSMPITSTELRPTDISLSTTGLGLEVRLDIFNGCGTETATTTFDLLVGPVLDVTIDTNFVCLGEAVTVTNNSIGDNLVYSWTATPPDGVSFSDPNERAPTITFNGDVGDYTISAEIGNPICGNLTWDTIIRVSAPVTATLEDIDPACDNITFTPVPTYSLDDEFIDSVRWTFPPGSMPITSTELRPTDISLSTTGLGLEVRLDIFNGCGTETATTTFDLLVGPVLDVTVDTNFVCLGEAVTITNNSMGDNLVYSWTATPPDGVSFSDPNERAPTITFNGDVGDYTISAEIGNPVCGNLNWDTIIRLSAPPEVSLDSIPDFCEQAEFLPSPTYNLDTSFIDSVRWSLRFIDSIVYTSTEPFPDSLSFGLDGDYTLSVSVFNGCGAATATRTFSVLEGPEPDFALSSNFICIGDTLRVTDNSTGDGLLYSWMVDESVFELNEQGDAEPYFVVLGPIGTYDIRVVLSNSVCEEVPWVDTVRVSEQPRVMIEPIPDFCDTALVDLTGIYSNVAFIDSVSWEIRDDSGALLFAYDSLAPAAAPLGVGNYTVTATVFNECGNDEDVVSFRVFAGPVLSIALDTNFVCLEDGASVAIINNSTGDSLSYQWTVEYISMPGPGGFTISGSGDTSPVIIFQDTGLYVVMVEVSNPVCDPVFWSDTVLVSEMPSLEIAPIMDDCGEARFTPVATSNNFGALDSLRWYFPGAEDSTSTSINPGEVSYLSPGTYTVSLVGWSGCGRDSVTQSFRVLEPIEINVGIDTNLGCGLPFEVTATNTTTGDDLAFEWSVTGPFAADVGFTDTLRNPVFTFQDTGSYVLILRVFNDICGEQFWRDTVDVIVPPLPLLVDQTQFCEEVTLSPIPDYQSYRLDSVRWDFAGSTLSPATSTELFPENIPYSGAGTYVYSLTAYNVCGTTIVRDTFIIDTIPEIILGPTDTICITDGFFTVPAAMPPDGTWRDSLGRPGVITEEGLFDPVAAGGGVTVIEYVFTVGACEVITQKDIFVVDLSDVAVVPDVLNACISDSEFILDNGTPGPGWYTGPGVTDTLGIMDPSSLIADSSYILTYHYRAPGTNCVETRDFTVNIRPLPVPDIRVTDSVCINVPVDIFHAGSDAVAWEWMVEDSIRYTTENIVHAFADTGFQRIQLVSTSEFGCRDSVSREIYVSGPPVVFFAKDTTMGCALLPVNFDNRSIGFQFATYLWDFGNGETSTEINPGTIFYDQGLEDTTYYINLTVMNACGTESYQDSVTVFPNPSSFLDVSQDQGCTPLYVEFLNITTGLPDRFEWYIDGELYSTDSIAPDRSFIAPDSMNVYYEVMLIAFNECGSDTARRTITVLPDDVRAFFSVEDQVGCEPFEVQFRNFSDPDTLVTFDWFFGDGSSSQLKNPLHTFRNTSDTTVVYEVTLVADNGCGQDSIMIPITVNPAPQVSFTAPEVTCARDTVFFTNTSEAVTNPIWVFGDGDTLTMIENPGHVFDLPGEYTVELTAFAVGTGCPSTWTETITIRPIPSADASVMPLFGCPDLEVTISNRSQNADFYLWDFGDGNTRVGANPGTHTYTEPGFYDITLTARDEFGCAHDSVVATVQVYEVPVVSFVTEPDRQCGVPAEYCFENNSENGGDYRWDFGNGQTSTENNPCITYDIPGDYVISLVATNEFLCETRTEIPITVYGIPVADFSIPDSTVCEVATVTFTNTSQEAEFAQWIFSDGFVSNDFNVTRTFTEVGLYGFTLIVGNGSGCTDTLITGNFLEVNPSPIADFDFVDRPDLLPTSIEFTDLSSSDAIIFGWDFDDGNTSDEMNPTHRYLSSFDKTVTHWVENEFGCTDTIQMVVDLDTLGALYIPNIFTPNDASEPEKDIFKPKGIGLSDYYIAVYTRNGQIVWESDAVDEEGIPEEAWDGTFQGQPMPAGTYVWRVHRASFFNGRPWRGMEDGRGQLRQTGYVTLVR